jgi:hypothetical protein
LQVSGVQSPRPPLAASCCRIAAAALLKRVLAVSLTAVPAAVVTVWPLAATAGVVVVVVCRPLHAASVSRTSAPESPRVFIGLSPTLTARTRGRGGLPLLCRLILALGGVWSWYTGRLLVGRENTRFGSTRISSASGKRTRSISLSSRSQSCDHSLNQCTCVAVRMQRWKPSVAVFMKGCVTSSRTTL